MSNSEKINSLSLVQYVEFIIGMSELTGKPAKEVNWDYCHWHGVVSEERYEEARKLLNGIAELNSSDYNYYTA